jgi:hypothetical protein
MERIRKSDEFQQSMDFENTKETMRNQQFNDKQTLEREKLNTQMQMKQTELEIARENKNKFDVKPAPKKTEKKKK